MIRKRHSIFFASMVCVIGSWLFYLKYTVLSIEERIREAQREIVIEKRNQHILKAEWKALTSPERIQHLSAKHLKDMHQVEPSQLREFDPLIFHSDKSRKTKRLSKLVDEILTSKGID